MSIIKLHNEDAGTGITFSFSDQTIVKLYIDQERRLEITPDPVICAQYIHDLLWFGTKGISMAHHNNVTIQLPPLLYIHCIRDEKRVEVKWEGQEIPPEIPMLQRCFDAYNNLKAFW